MESAMRYLTAALYKFVDLPDHEALRDPLLA
jgi:predicted sulfurtransferase